MCSCKDYIVNHYYLLVTELYYGSDLIKIIRIVWEADCIPFHEERGRTNLDSSLLKEFLIRVPLT
ncbi:uncharacterized protein DS421_9g272290 [Arachis hypogaea]|nr:uncharacterized protein DS421_9g272290 [Arachis hypogaea]